MIQQQKRKHVDDNEFNLEDLENILDKNDTNNDYENETFDNDVYTTTQIRDKYKIPESSVTDAQLINGNIFEKSIRSEDTSEGSFQPNSCRNKSLFQFITGLVIQNDQHIYHNNSMINDVPIHSLNLNQYAVQFTLDYKQVVAYEIMCLSFVRFCLERSRDKTLATNNNCFSQVQSIFETTSTSDYNKTLNFLKENGAEEQLVMFLTGAAGSGKSQVINSVRSFCHHFCRLTCLPFDEFSLFITATIGSAASGIGGTTTDSAVCLMKKTQLTEAEKEKFLNCYMLLIDEISYFDRNKIEKLDKHLKILMQNPTKAYGGLHVIFVGDFHQIECFSNNTVYKNDFVQWHSTVNCVIFLENNHRFKDDPEYGKILEQFRTGNIEDSTFEKINSRLVGCNGVTIPKDCDELAYACSTNKERNSISANVFSNHIAKTHPKISENIDVPMHTLVIESKIADKESNTNVQRNYINFFMNNVVIMI